MSDPTQNEDFKKPSCCTPAANHDATSKSQQVGSNITGSAPSRPAISLPGGTFLMGTDYRDAFPADGEGPVRLVSHSPFAIDTPGAHGNGRSSTRIVQSLDIYRTLAELCHLEVPAGIEGTSLTPLLNNPRAPWTQPAFSIWERRRRHSPRHRRPHRTVSLRRVRQRRRERSDALRRTRRPYGTHQPRRQPEVPTDPRTTRKTHRRLQHYSLSHLPTCRTPEQ
jgi:hypothetical protein